ncbi:MAG: hypothetical protein ACOYL6_07790 [Bacteriovoracaceae bacterium]
MKKNASLIFGLLILSSNSFALMDYTPEDEAAPVPTNKSVKKIARGGGGGKNRPTQIEFATRYDSIKVNTNNGATNGGIDLVKSQLLVDTPYSVFIGGSYWQASSADLYATQSSQAGNPEALLGFNWFRTGSDVDLAKVDIYGGYSFKANNSLFGTSRNDQIFGLHTTKRLSDFAFGLGGEYRKTGRPSNDQEISIGDITKIEASLGWAATSDIRFSLEASVIKVKAADASLGNALKNNLDFSTLSPKMHLGLTSAVELEFGAAFRTRKNTSDKAQDIMDARLLNYSGAYGNSMFVSLNISG